MTYYVSSGTLNPTHSLTIHTELVKRLERNGWRLRKSTAARTNATSLDDNASVTELTSHKPSTRHVADRKSAASESHFGSVGVCSCMAHTDVMHSDIADVRDYQVYSH